MKMGKPLGTGIALNPDMTPMIDVTFQLIIFFMLTLNFMSDDQSELIKLPGSELAKPPDTPWEAPITLQLTDSVPPRIIVGGDMVELSQLRTMLEREKEYLREQNKSIANATVIIRADRAAKTGVVQKMIKTCQDLRFERFVLRAKEQDT